MNAKILPNKIAETIERKLNRERVYEIRLRADRALTVNYGGNFFYFGQDGLCDLPSKAFKVTSQILHDIIVKASDYSLYTVNRNICDGFVTIEGGVRIGITGEYVWENDRIKTIKNFSGLTIRFPHEIRGCANNLFKPFTSGGLKNCLIISPPACGKTTMLRDLCRSISEMGPDNNVLLVDERSEMAACLNGVPQLDIGNNVDVISNCDKATAIIRGIRIMNPHVIITDELAQSEDVEAVYAAACSGVKIIASVHAADQYDLMNKTTFDNLIKHRMFARYAVLSDKPTIGTVSGVYDENFGRIY